jgi:hypothetical protein
MTVVGTVVVMVTVRAAHERGATDREALPNRRRGVPGGVEAVRLGADYRGELGPTPVHARAQRFNTRTLAALGPRSERESESDTDIAAVHGHRDDIGHGPWRPETNISAMPPALSVTGP